MLHIIEEDAGEVVLEVMTNDLYDPVAITIAGITVTIADQDFPGSTETVPTAVPDPLTGDTVTLPNGTVEIQPSGTVIYRAKNNYNGTDFFTYTVEDAFGNSDQGSR